MDYVFKVFPTRMKTVIQSYLENGGNLFVSGAYIGSDMFLGKTKDSDDYKFCTEILKYKLASDHAVITGNTKFITGEFYRSVRY